MAPQPLQQKDCNILPDRELSVSLSPLLSQLSLSSLLAISVVCKSLGRPPLNQPPKPLKNFSKMEKFLRGLKRLRGMTPGSQETEIETQRHRETETEKQRDLPLTIC